MICGSGLPSGFANSDHNQSYVTVNFVVVQEFQLTPGTKLTTARVGVNNLLGGTEPRASAAEKAPRWINRLPTSVFDVRTRSARQSKYCSTANVHI
jgi:hypothetical protein